MDGAEILGSLPEKNINSPNRRGEWGGEHIQASGQTPLLKICNFSNFLLLLFKTNLSPVLVEGMISISYLIFNLRKSHTPSRGRMLN